MTAPAIGFGQLELFETSAPPWSSRVYTGALVTTSIGRGGLNPARLYRSITDPGYATARNSAALATAQAVPNRWSSVPASNGWIKLGKAHHLMGRNAPRKMRGAEFGRMVETCRGHECSKGSTVAWWKLNTRSDLSATRAR